MKKCSGCFKRKNLNNFYKRKTGKRAGEYYEKCKTCMKKEAEIIIDKIEKDS